MTNVVTMAMWRIVLAAVVTLLPWGVARAEATLTRSGAMGLGLGLELPMVGIMSGVAGKGSLGAGFALGAALSWELTPLIVPRLYVGGSQAFASRVPVRYLEGGRQLSERPLAAWRGIEVGAGAAYQWRDALREWTPYAGVDAGLMSAGFLYTLTGDLEKLAAAELAAGSAPLEHESRAWTWVASVRGGMRLQLRRWLSTQTELMLSYLPVPRAPISNTRAARDVQGAADDLWLVRATFTVRIGI